MNPNLILDDLWYATQTPIHSGEPTLRVFAAKAVFDTELKDRFKKLKQLAKAAGYTHLTVGTDSEHWQGCPRNSVVAEPKQEFKIWDVLRAAGFRTACGNGLRHADQSQLTIDFKALSEIAGKHEL